MINRELYYQTSNGTRFPLLSGSLRLREAPFHRYEWKADATAKQYGVKLNRFTRDAKEYEAILQINGTRTSRAGAMEDLYGAAEVDVRNMTPGRIVSSVTDGAKTLVEYIPTYVTKMNVDPAGMSGTQNEVTFYCPTGLWVYEHRKTFYEVQDTPESTFLNYPYGYNYDFTSGNRDIIRWNTNTTYASDFVLTIYGAISSPAIIIDGNVYEVYADLRAGERLVIDSRADHKTIIKYQTNGVSVNLFDMRNKKSEIFKPIPGGSVIVSWPGGFSFDLVLYVERSMPLWLPRRTD